VSSARPERRRIGYLLSLFPCYDETFILREIKGLSERGVTPTIFSLRRRRDPVIQEDARPLMAATRYLGYLAPEVVAAVGRTLVRQPRTLAGIVGRIVRATWRRPLTLAKSLALLPKTLRFAELAREEGLEHLHAHWASYPSTSAWVISRLTGISWSFTCHAHDLFQDPSLLPEKIARAEFVLTCTADNKRFLEGISPEAARKVSVSYHGLDVGRFQPAFRPATGEPPQLLAVGSLLPCKGFDLLIEACRRLKQRGLAFRLTLAGGGPLEATLREAIARAELGDRVRLTGYVTQAQLVPLYQAADLFVLPAVLEMHWGIPNVLVEALACAVPVVTTGLPSLPELVEDGVHGLVAANRDPEDLAEKMAALIADPARRHAMGLAGRRRVEERFDIGRTIPGVLEPLLHGPEAAGAASNAAGLRLKTPVSPLRRAVKRAVVSLTAMAVTRDADALRILMYHRINASHPGDRLSIHPDVFRGQMEALAGSGRPVLPLSEALTALRCAGPLPKGAVCLTFDDGFRDNFDFALPVLERLGLPATFFVVTGHVGTASCIDRYRGCCDEDRSMDWAQLRELIAQGHAVGGHSRSHRELADLEPDQVRWEVAGCHADLLGHLGRAPELFCYPRGSESPLVRRVVAEAGYAGACTVKPGANPRGVDPFGLRRTEITGDDSLEQMSEKLRGGFDGWHRLVQHVQSWGAA